MQRHNVIIPKGDGGVEVYPMKQWLRDHPENLPPGVETTTSTSHQLRGILRRRGWTMKETHQEILLMPPNVDLSEVERVAGSDSDDAEDNSDEIAFTLEHQLRDFIAANLSSIDVNGKRLRVFIDPAGRDGIEFSTHVGFVDILAVDEAGAFFVFELKRASSSDRAIGQLARYMGWVKHTIGKDRAIHGVAKSIDKRLKYAASLIPMCICSNMKSLFN